MSSLLCLISLNRKIYMKSRESKKGKIELRREGVCELVFRKGPAIDYEVSFLKIRRESSKWKKNHLNLRTFLKMPINISMSRPQNKNTLSLLKILSVNNDRYKKRITATPKHSFWFKWYLIKILFGLQSRSHGTYVKISLKKNGKGISDNACLCSIVIMCIFCFSLGLCPCTK